MHTQLIMTLSAVLGYFTLLAILNYSLEAITTITVTFFTMAIVSALHRASFWVIDWQSESDDYQKALSLCLLNYVFCNVQFLWARDNEVCLRTEKVSSLYTQNMPENRFFSVSLWAQNSSNISRISLKRFQ